MDIKPIKTEADYEATLEEIERLLENDVEPDTSEGDRLEVLSTLVEAYEKEHYPVPLPDPIEAIKYFLESRSLSRADLEPFIGTRARVSEILNRKRPLTLRMIRRLEAGLGIPAKVLIQEYDLDSSEESVDSVLISWFDNLIYLKDLGGRIVTQSKTTTPTKFTYMQVSSGSQGWYEVNISNPQS